MGKIKSIIEIVTLIASLAAATLSEIDHLQLNHEEVQLEKLK